MKTMTNARWVIAIGAAMVALLGGVAEGQGRVTGDRPDCVSAQALVQSLAYGYSHRVHLANRCAYAVDCRVSTDVNPQVQTAHLEAGASTDVPTFLGSPASTFVAHVDCAEPGGSSTHRRPRVSE